ncbi:MAG: cell wall/surface repeat protein [Anaerolineaceae bacterium]|nr:MAG: cell wall/surface repeat protein [Anaerolineaceae bacterium]
MKSNIPSRAIHVTVLAFLLASLLLTGAPARVLAGPAAAPLYTAVQASDTAGSLITNPNTSRTVAVSPTGIIYVAYHGPSGIRVARSLDRGATFQPSVQITVSNQIVEVAVDSNGVVYVAYVDAPGVIISRSTNNGQTFSAPAIAAAIGSTNVHIATDPPYVYLVPQDGANLLVNSANGVGAFSINSTGLGGQAFADVHVDPASGDVFVIADDPALKYTVSTNHGATFGAVVNLAGNIFYSTTAASFSTAGRFVYVSGQTTQAYQINLDTSAITSLTFGNVDTFQGRSLAADPCGNVLDSYTTGGQVHYRASQDLAATFAGAVNTGASQNQSVAINPSNYDIVVAYQDAAGGVIRVSVYSGELLNCTPAPIPAALPATGFAPGQVTMLPVQPAASAYSNTDLTLEIPSLGLKMPIVGVPVTGGNWDVSWLSNQAGWLQGTAFPSHAGNSVLTSHVWNASNQPGPFINLGNLRWGDKIIIRAFGAEYTYEVRSVRTIAPNNINSALKHEEAAWLTLLTCKSYNDATGQYDKRLIVRAVLVDVK